MVNRMCTPFKCSSRCQNVSHMKLQHACPPPCDGCEGSEGGSSVDAGAQHNIWNGMLELFPLRESSPTLQRALERLELCRAALPCHFAPDVFENYKK